MTRLLSILLAGSTLMGASAFAQTAGGQSGYDESLDAISPSDEAVSIGLAGEDPADISGF